jgi:hypothetical protein
MLGLVSHHTITVKNDPLAGYTDKIEQQLIGKQESSFPTPRN